MAGLANVANLTPAVISGNLNLGGVTRVIDVQAGNLVGLNPNSTITNANDMTIAAAISNGGSPRTTSASPALTGNNTYTVARPPSTAAPCWWTAPSPTAAVAVNTGGTLGGTLAPPGQARTLVTVRSTRAIPITSVGKLTTAAAR